jgi:transporter family protein
MAVWGVYALLAAVFAACVTLFAKIGLSGVDAVVATTIRAGVMTLLLVGVCLAAGKRFDASLDRSAILWISASGVAGALSWLFYFLALRDGSAAAVAALDRTSIVFILLGSAAFLAERLTSRSAAGAALVVLGAVLLTYKSG